METVETWDREVAERNVQCALDWLTKYRETTGCRGVVIGISGGKDSTVVAMLAKRVWGASILGVLMPNGEQADIDDSKKIVDVLNIPYCVVDIHDAYQGLINNIDNSGELITDKALTNIPPRLRMATLYAIGQSYGYRVLGTGNASEAFIGWFTKWGDGAYDANPLAGFTCTEVIEMGKVLAEYFDLPIEYIVKTPADGLTGKSDEENFGFTYAELDMVINAFNTGKALTALPIDKAIIEKIINMHEATEHKRRLPAACNDATWLSLYRLYRKQ